MTEAKSWNDGVVMEEVRADKSLNPVTRLTTMKEQVGDMISRAGKFSQ